MLANLLIDFPLSLFEYDFNGKAKLYLDTNEMEKLINSSDFGIGACGTSSWERCFLSLPTIGVKTAENQELIYNSLVKSKLILGCGSWKDLTKKKLTKSINKIALDSDLRVEMAKRCSKVFDGRGVERIYNYLGKT